MREGKINGERDKRRIVKRNKQRQDRGTETERARKSEKSTQEKVSE